MLLVQPSCDLRPGVMLGPPLEHLDEDRSRVGIRHEPPTLRIADISEGDFGCDVDPPTKCALGSPSKSSARAISLLLSNREADSAVELARRPLFGVDLATRALNSIEGN